MSRHAGRMNGQRRPLASLFARHAGEILQPDGILFVEKGRYHWRALDELAVPA
ncbi:hypothetical protein ACFWN5_19215 [Streptomyces sp. NPDC058430]|uniref:hypothetical protein n=1 Tax=unclassified Streptomyces TaxID=2593676 RepID=UPI00362AEB68